MIMDLQKRKELKKKLYTIIFKTDTEEGKRFDIILLNVILLSVILAAIESVVAFNARYALPFRICEWIITILFTIEYATRIYCSPNRKKYIFSVYGIIDLLSILPFFIGILYSSTHYLIVIRALRLLRIFRILIHHDSRNDIRSFDVFGRRKCKSFFLQHSQKHILGSRHYHDRRIRRHNTYHVLRSDNFSHRHVTRILDTGRSYRYYFFRTDQTFTKKEHYLS